MLANCFRFAPRDSVPGLIAKICKYLKDHPGWSEEELEEQIKQFVGQTGVESFNGRTGSVVLNESDVNNLKIASAYFAEGNETIEELNLVELYKQGIRFVFTNWNSATSSYDMSFVLDYFSGSGNVVYYPIAIASGGSSESPVVSVNSMVGAVTIPVVDVSETDSKNQFAKIFINESEDYPIAPSYDSDRLGGKPPSYYAYAADVDYKLSKLNEAKANDADLAKVAKSGSYNDLSNTPKIPTVPSALPNPNALTFTGAVNETYDGSVAKSVAIPTVPESLKNPNKLTFTGAVTAEYDGSSEVSVEIPAVDGEDWQLIASSDTEATANIFEFNADNEGNSFSLKKAVLFVWLSKRGSYSYINLGIQKFNWLIKMNSSSDECVQRAEFKKDADGEWMCEAGSAKYNNTTYRPTENYSYVMGKGGNTIKDTITSIFYEHGSYTTIAKYALYGIKE